MQLHSFGYFASLRLCVGLAFLVITSATGPALRAQENLPIKPRGLKPGDTIALVAPSGAISRSRLELARQRLETSGYRVRVSETVDRRRGYLAGEDRQRADELIAAFTNPEVDAVFCIAGGYGTTRLLDLLDYGAIAANPKVFTGFSDITGLHLAIAAKCNFITFHAPNAEYGLGSKDGLPEFHASYFWPNLRAREEPFEALVYRPPRPDLPIRAVRPGTARGRLIGGNLSLVAALIGTPYEIHTEGRVLFLEDVNEAPYRVDRMLSQLRLAGKLDRPAAVVLGSYHKCTSDRKSTSLSLDQVFDDYFGEAPYPVIKNVPCGHGPWNATLPIGAMFEVNGTTATLTLLERPVQ